MRKTAVLLCALALISLFACSTPQAEPPGIAELLSLGEQYLTDLDYEQALVQFLKVIELEPRNVRAYLGAAEAYVALGQTEEAIAILEQGLQQTGDAEISARLEELRGANAPESSGDAQEPDSPLTPEQLAMLAPLEAALLAYDMEAAFPILATEEFRALCRSLDAAYRRDEHGEWQLSFFQGESVAGEPMQNAQICLIVDWETGPIYLAEVHLLNGEIDSGSMMTCDRSEGETGEPYHIIDVAVRDGGYVINSR